MIFPLFAQSPQELIARTQQTATVVFDRVAVFGFRANYAPGKTEVVVYFRGTGAADARRHLCLEGGLLVLT
eukprot:10889516-Lingulodinium_polyedra.AAC.1